MTGSDWLRAAYELKLQRGMPRAAPAPAPEQQEPAPAAPPLGGFDGGFASPAMPPREDMSETIRRRVFT